MTWLVKFEISWERLRKNKTWNQKIILKPSAPSSLESKAQLKPLDFIFLNTSLEKKLQNWNRVSKPSAKSLEGSSWLKPLNFSAARQRRTGWNHSSGDCTRPLAEKLLFILKNFRVFSRKAEGVARVSPETANYTNPSPSPTSPPLRSSSPSRAWRERVCVGYQ